MKKELKDQKRKDAFDKVYPYFVQGLKRDEIASILGLSEYTIDACLNYFGYSFGKRTKIKDQILEMHSFGLSANEISQKTGSNLPYVYKVVRDNGLKFFSNNECHDDIAELRRSGCSVSEICLITGKNRKVVSDKCRDIGLRETEAEKEEFRKWNSEQKSHSENWARQYIHDKTDGRLEYVSGYINMDSHVIVRCSKCNNEWDMGFTSFRSSKNPGICKNCYQSKQKPKYDLAYYEEKQRIKEENRLKKKEYEKKQIIKREQRAIRNCSGTQRFFNFCSQCGCVIFDRQNGMCKECTDKAKDARHCARRRARTIKQIVDPDITSKKLFERDNGICYICGGKCDWNNYQIKNGYFISGRMYPSIDHVIPLAKGGLHSWENVRLAHKICNSVKRDKVYDEKDMENTNNEGDGESWNLPRVI